MFSQLKSRWQILEAKAAVLESDLEILKKNRDDDVKKEANFNLALGVVQELALVLQNQAQLKIAAVGTSVLQIFGEEYSLRIDFSVKRSRTAATFVVQKGDVEVDPMECGGGIVDAISFALRIASILSKPETIQRRLVILDEPFKYVSVEFRPAIAALIHRLAERFDLQFIIVTHLPELE